MFVSKSPKRARSGTSLRGGLLRLMMAGLVFAFIDPTGFTAGFVISEIIAQLSTIKMEELLMVKKVAFGVMAYARRIKSRVIASLKAHLTFGLSLLTSL
jgi:hypothetical protein